VAQVEGFVEFMYEKPKVLFAARGYSAPIIHREYTFLGLASPVRSGRKPPMNAARREGNNGTLTGAGSGKASCSELDISTREILQGSEISAVAGQALLKRAWDCRTGFGVRATIGLGVYGFICVSVFRAIETGFSVVFSGCVFSGGSKV
jgi:hypothetical protein